ncbi:MAG: XTP/dITP diphosphohydrolase, partial [Rubrobacteraceae bacterium]|nr:XTP/dITP diphosphohydrolase [Rubrobacteraceae bacterium]
MTSNPNKAREAAEILGVEMRSVGLDLPELQALDVAQVAVAKAAAARATLGDPDSPVLVEDSGLVIDAWNGLPGALTKWFLRSVGNEGLLKMLSGEENRSARAVCAVAIALADGSVRVFV